MSDVIHVITWADTDYYYIDLSKKMFVSFTEIEDCYSYLNLNPSCGYVTFDLSSPEDDDNLTRMLAREGFLGGIINGQICPIDKDMLEEPSADFTNNLMLHYKQKELQQYFYKSLYYFFAQVNNDGYLVLASKQNRKNKETSILCFSCINNIDINLAKTLFNSQYELIQSYPQEEHNYSVNPQTKQQIIINSQNK